MKEVTNMICPRCGTSNSEVYKEETVYVNAKASGKIDKVTVSNWLKNSGSVSGDLEYDEKLKKYHILFCWLNELTIDVATYSSCDNYPDRVDAQKPDQKGG